MKNDFENFGNNLKLIRKSRGMTKAELAKELGVGVATITNYEANRRTPSLATVSKIATALDTTMNMLIHGY
ncbi:MAG: helix-turn-helix transcriptional regulator [Clostridia bacterium]|nr:helix-turn-helix transcriptional regulator [Clostridia bacterium]